jgi:hypothetical protein
MTINSESGSIGPPHTPVTTSERRNDTIIRALAGTGGSVI